MSAHISNYLVFCVLITLVSGADQQGNVNINNGSNGSNNGKNNPYNGYINGNNGYNNPYNGYINSNNGYNNRYNGYNNGFNDNNNGYNHGNNRINYLNKEIYLPEIIGNLPSKLVNLPYALNPILNSEYIRDLSKVLGIQKGYSGKVDNKGGVTGKSQDNGSYIKLTSTTRKPDFSNEPSTTIAPLDQQQQLIKTLLDAINGNPEAKEAMLAILG